MTLRQDVRDCAAKHGLYIDEADTKGMGEETREFDKPGGEVYSKA